MEHDQVSRLTGRPNTELSNITGMMIPLTRKLNVYVTYNNLNITLAVLFAREWLYTIIEDYEGWTFCLLHEYVIGFEKGTTSHNNTIISY